VLDPRQIAMPANHPDKQNPGEKQQGNQCPQPQSVPHRAARPSV
jgi:hypothetical protein